VSQGLTSCMLQPAPSPLTLSPWHPLSPLNRHRAGLDKDATAAAASMLGMLAAMALHYWALLPATRWVSAKAAAAARWLRGQVGRGGRMAPAAAVGQWVYGYA
jgi:hypothetical protein